MARTTAAVALAVLAAHAAVRAQGGALGMFRWQLQPFCNVVTVNVAAQGGVFTVDGFDDQCGAPQRAPLVGLATPNPDGSIGLGLHVVTSPDGRGLDIAARIDLATLGGPWSDSAGNTGSFVFNAAAGGPPRPAPMIPLAALAPGAIGAAHINPGQVQARLNGTCPKEQPVRRVQPDGTLACVDVFNTVEPRSTSIAGLFSSLAVGSDGLPVIGYQRNIVGGADHLRVIHCGNPACTAGNVGTTVDQPAFDVAYWISMAIGVDGFPVMAHEALLAGGDGLRVTHCNSVACSSATSTTVDVFSSGGVGQRPSLAIGTDGLPIISHYDFTNRQLRVTHCSNVACTAASTTVVDGTVADVGEFSAIAIGTDGLPVIAYPHTTAGNLRVTHCGNATCTAGNVSTTVDDQPLTVGRQTSMAIGADGLPVIAHRDEGAQALRITHCGNLACTAGNVSTTVDDPANAVGLDTSIAIAADGLPIVSHHDDSANALRVTHCGNAACSTGNRSRTIDPMSEPPTQTTLAVGLDGLPIVSYAGEALGLRVAKCGTRDCQ